MGTVETAVCLTFWPHENDKPVTVYREQVIRSGTAVSQFVIGYFCISPIRVYSGFLTPFGCVLRSRDYYGTHHLPRIILCIIICFSKNFRLSGHERAVLLSEIYDLGGICKNAFIEIKLI